MPTNLTITLALTLLLAASASHATTLFVAPNGSDTSPGTAAAPVASLQGARDAIRKLKAAGPLTEPVTVKISKGAYTLTEPLVFTPEDSGTAQAPITYEAAPGAVFTGGKPITGWKKQPDGLWTTKIPEVAAGNWYPEQLWVNGRRAVRACTPNVQRHGETPVPRWNYMWRKLPSGIDPLTGQQADLSRRAFYARPEDLAVLKDVPRDRLTDVTVVVYHAWESCRLRLASADLDSGALIFTGNSPWAFGWLGPNQRFNIENVRAALDQPGEWYLDRDGTLSYLPMPGDDMTKAIAVAPVIDHFMDLKGDAATGQLVEHLTFRGLRLNYSGYTLPPEGHGDGQAAVTIPATIMVDGARNLTFDRCQIAHTGAYGLWLRTGCRDCRVQQTEFRDLGAGGVKLGEAMIRPNEAEQTHACVVDNNLITAGGRIFPGAVGVWVGQSSDNQITHNDISDLFYTGVSVGWSWGYSPTICKRNRTEFNHLHHLGWGVLSDQGGVYTLGLQEGASVSNNRIHDVYSWNKYGYAGLGLYNDEGSTGITMENNLVYNTRDMTYHQHYGRENIIRNNILACGENFQLSYAREEPHLGYTFENNIVYYKTGKLFWQGSPGQRQFKFDRNLYWNAAGEPLDFMGLSFEEWQALGQDQNSAIADPKFKDPDKFDFTLAPDSPALKLGFKPFDYTKAGLYGDPAWTRRAVRTFVPVQYAPDPPPPPPFVLNEDFEAYPVGATPADGTFNLEGASSIKVSDETASPRRGQALAGPGTKSLKFTDVAGLQYSFNPHLVYNMDYTRGEVICAFDLRLEPGAEFWHEFRDWSANPYLTGPSLNIVGGKLKARDRELMDLPLSQWVHLELKATLGNPTYQLAVTLPGQEPQTFTDLKIADEKWHKTSWIGFVSNAKEASVYHIDNLQIHQ